MSSPETIFALATPPGISGVAVIRLSGPQARQAFISLSGLEAPIPRHAHYVTLRARDGSSIDQALALYFAAPASFTGEDVVEFHTHGSIAVIRELLDTLSAMPGLRPAEAGEFTRRAFINGKMDLVEAEGLADLIAARTRRQKEQAIRQMGGELSHYYDRLRTGIIRTLAHLEAYIDFPDEEIPESVMTGIGGEIEALQLLIEGALTDHHRGERLREGIRIVILGAPNVGKSSLLNRLSGKEAAIVSHKAGTTRDAIEIHLDFSGFPAILTDTAGLRDGDDDIEAEGIRRARQRAGEADIKLVLFDGSEWPDADEGSLALLDENSIAIVTKSDLVPAGLRSISSPIPSPLFISTKTGEGIDSLLQDIDKHIIIFFASGEAPFITRNRHRALLSTSLFHLKKALSPDMLELKCEELRLAALAIGKITGKIEVDDVLDVIFSSFCIGK